MVEPLVTLSKPTLIFPHIPIHRVNCKKQNKNKTYICALKVDKNVEINAEVPPETVPSHHGNQGSVRKGQHRL